MTMKYTILLWPHANARYRVETVRLAAKEMRLMLDVLCPEAEISIPEKQMPTLEIETGVPFSESAITGLCRHSLMYAIFENVENGLLKPVAERFQAFIGEDLPAILKYKGKTNEMFLQMLINVALYVSDFAQMKDTVPEFLDPMCGRGTSLFVAANYGWNTTGSDVDKNDLSETEKFLTRYFEYHRMKHRRDHGSRTLKKGKPVPVTEFIYAEDPQAFKEKNTRSLKLANTDAGKISEAFGKEKFHVIATDLPYGIQHAAVGGKLTGILKSDLPAWYNALKKGGAIAVSFNAQTMKRDVVEKLMTDAGFTLPENEACRDFSHWVEQAVTRDIVVARK